MFFINDARFITFAQAAECAFVHARQRQESVKVRAFDGTLLADFVPNSDGTVSVFATDIGRSHVEAMA